MRSRFERGNWLLMVFVLVGMIVLVGASPSWNDAEGGTYSGFEDIPFLYNFSANVTNPVSGMVFSFYSINNYNSSNSNLDLLFPWITLSSSSGVMMINATNNSQSGIFNISASVVDSSGHGNIGPFTFNISSVNDAPIFTELVDGGLYQVNENLTNLIRQYNATDEEGEVNYSDGYPLSFDYNISWCNSTLNLTGSCNDLLNLSLGDDNKSMVLNFTLTNGHVGYYNVSFWVNDSYDVQSEINVTFEVVNVNDVPNITFACDDNRSMVEDDIMSCWINATDVDENNNLTFAISSNLAQFTFNDSSKSYVYVCGGAGQCNASANVTFVLNDSAVGNWSVNISVTDTGLINTVGWSNFSFFVNNTEDNVSIQQINDFTEYDGNPHEFSVVAYDDDLLVSQHNIKNERLTFASNNTNLVYFIGVVNSVSGNKATRTAYVNYTYAIDNNITSASIKINVTDRLGISGPEIYSSDETIFLVTFDNSNNVPVWNGSKVCNFSIQEDNSSWGGINLSEGYVSDSDGENITFYYSNETQFDNFNLSNSSGSWIINFTPSDVDVGYHDITIYASDGNVNVAHQFNFNVSNVADAPSIEYLYIEGNYTMITNGSTVLMSEGNATTFVLIINDDDFLIPDYQVSTYGFYNESLNINSIITNSTGGIVDLFSFSFIGMNVANNSWAEYNASFTPNISKVGNYMVFVNITDNSSISINRTFYLNISATFQSPILGLIDNVSVTVNDYVDFNVTATDNEDDYNGIDLSFSIERLNASAPNLTIGNLTGVVSFNMSSNESYAGIWGYNVTVTDSNLTTDSQVFYLYVYGAPNITLPLSSYVYNWAEGNATGSLGFNVSYGINDTNLTYLLYLDKIVYSNSTAFSYTSLNSSVSLRNETNWTWVEESNFSWNFTPSYTDESYGMLKNLTLVVYNPDYPLLNDSINWKVNVSHANQNVSCPGYIGRQSGYAGTAIPVNLSEYFEDVDYWDETINQDVNFTISTQAGSANNVELESSFDGWILNLFSEDATDEVISVTAHEYDSNNVSIWNATSNEFEVEFIPPVTETVTVPRTSSSTKLKYFSLRVIVPGDIVISDENYIDVPFSLQNSGVVDLTGIDLTSKILYGGRFSDDIRIEFDSTFVPLLKVGEIKDYNMRIFVDTHKSGKYKATIFANVTSPKLSDWGDFFIELKKINETEAESILIFTEKLISENPECLELTELFNEANVAFASGDFETALNLAREVGDACEDAIASNEQIKYPIVGLVRDNFYYISFSTLIIFILGFVFYVYKRVRFNKYKVDEL